MRSREGKCEALADVKANENYSHPLAGRTERLYAACMSHTEPCVGDMTNHTQVLREAGLRVTQQRTAILTALAAADDHPTADEVLTKARTLDDTVSFATVYRTLGVLEGAGLIRRLSFQDAPARYEMTPQSEHDHLVDIETGELIEMPSDEIARLRRKIADELGYEIVSQHTVLRARRRTRAATRTSPGIPAVPNRASDVEEREPPDKEAPRPEEKS